MLWAVKIFLLSGVLLMGQSVWALVDGFRFLRFQSGKRRSNPGKPYADPQP